MWMPFFIIKDILRFMFPLFFLSLMIYFFSWHHCLLFAKQNKKNSLCWLAAIWEEQIVGLVSKTKSEDYCCFCLVVRWLVQHSSWLNNLYRSFPSIFYSFPSLPKTPQPLSLFFLHHHLPFAKTHKEKKITMLNHMIPKYLGTRSTYGIHLPCLKPKPFEASTTFSRSVIDVFDHPICLIGHSTLIGELFPLSMYTVFQIH